MAIILGSLWIEAAQAGMPAPLPSGWTADHQPEWASTGRPATSVFPDARLQAISFFVAILLLSAWGVQRLWRSVQQEIAWLPTLTYRRSLSLVILWGLLFVIVLTMISGARELMTPGAWRKQGWTYKLNESPAPPSTGSQSTKQDLQVARRQVLERLRLALWQYAATHEGHFPQADDPAIDPELWKIPGWPGVKFILAPNCVTEQTGRVLVCEPELEGDERQVLLTNGMLGTMRTEEIRQSLGKGDP